jgi:hypothetical protein
MSPPNVSALSSRLYRLEIQKLFANFGSVAWGREGYAAAAGEASFGERLAEEAKRLRERAKALPPRAER